MPRSLAKSSLSLSWSEWKLSAREGSESSALMVESPSEPEPDERDETASAVNADRAAIGRRPSEGGTPNCTDRGGGVYDTVTETYDGRGTDGMVEAVVGREDGG
jgi:hypothetical protein